VILIRCTQRLLKLSRVAHVIDPPPHPGALREWYAHAVPLRFSGRWLTLYFSADTLLSVLTRGRTLGATLDQFRARLPALLRTMEVPEAWIAERMSGMDEVVAMRATDRRRLGYMTHVGYAIEAWQDEAPSYEALDLDTMEHELAGTPYGASSGRGTMPYEAVRAQSGLQTDVEWHRRFLNRGGAA
jgi:hypothetical protein